MDAFEAKSLASKMTFAPLAFCAIRVMVETGFLEAIDKSADGLALDEIVKKTGLSDYAVLTLAQAGLAIKILSQENKNICTTKLAYMFLYDEMTKVNADFVNDVCYQGSFYLKESFINQKPEGLKVFGGWNTIYEALPHLPDKVKKSWFSFDHFYSDNAFKETVKIMLDKKPKVVFDIGCNTGRFEQTLLSTDAEVKSGLIDLKSQLEMAAANLEKLGFLDRCSFYACNVLDEKAAIEPGADIIFMSQFLDCFSKEQAVRILQKVRQAMGAQTSVFILEPLIDKQKFSAAELSLSLISLYFTAMANGVSKMFSSTELMQIVDSAGLRVVKVYENIGDFDYTLIECGI
jgi:ubiquinone/menaquinone biosynthesis C-methylase UbiE